MAKLKDERWDLVGETELGLNHTVTDGVMRVAKYSHDLVSGKLRVEVQISEVDGKWRWQRAFTVDTADDPNVRKNDITQALEAEYTNATKQTGQGAK